MPAIRINAGDVSTPAGGSGTADERAALQERARQLARAPAVTLRPSEALEVLTFRLGDERCAIEVNVLREVMFRPAVTPLPGTSSLLTGIANLRGDVLAIIDLRELAGLGKPDPDDATFDNWVIVCGGDRPEFGIVADAVHEVTTIRLDTLRSPTVTGAASPPGLIRGVLTDALTVLDGAAILQDPRLFIDD